MIPVDRCASASTAIVCLKFASNGAQCVWMDEACQSPWRICADAPRNSTGCGSRWPCMWNPRLSLCTVACDLINTSSSCPMNGLCLWSHFGHCERRCEFRYNDMAACDDDRSCSWRAVDQTCRLNCFAAGENSTECHSFNSACEFNVTSYRCESRCLAQPDPVSCANRAATPAGHCQWDDSRNVCASSPLPPEPVPTNPLCDYFTTALDCSSKGKPHLCAWDSVVNRCREWNSVDAKCRQYGTEIQCNEQLACIFDGGVCGVLCQLQSSEALCRISYGCVYAFGTCQRRCEFRFDTPQACDNNRLCSWNAKMEVCRENCASFSDQGLPCEASVCVPGSQRWSCLPGCAMAVNAAGCAVMPAPIAGLTCIWNDRFRLCEEANATTTTTAAPSSGAFTQFQCNNTACANPGCISQTFPQNTCLRDAGSSATTSMAACVADAHGQPIVLNVTTFTDSTNCTGTSTSAVVPLRQCTFDTLSGLYVDFQCPP